MVVALVDKIMEVAAVAAVLLYTARTQLYQYHLIILLLVLVELD